MSIPTPSEKDEELIFSSETDTDTESESESESESEVEEVVIPVKSKKTKKITPSKLGHIEQDPTPPPPPRKPYQVKDPAADRRKITSLKNLEKARAARSAKCAQRKQEELQRKLGQYEFKQESESESSDEEIILTKRKTQQTLPKETPVLEKKVYTLPKEKKEKKKIVVDHPNTSSRKKKIKHLEQQVANLEQIVAQQSKDKKKDRRKKTIINIQNAPLVEEPLKVDKRKVLFDMGI